MHPNHRFIPILALAGTLLLGALALPASGQERSWTASVFVEGGGVLPIRTLGRNVGIFPGLDEQQVVSDLENFGSFGGGVEIDLPATNLRFRAVYNTTTGGAVTGRIGFCGDPDNPLVTGDICEPAETDATIQSFAVDVGFVRGRPGAIFRPVILLGVGLRKYEFGDPDCPPLDPVETAGRTCLLMEDLWLEEGGLTPILRFGLGIENQSCQCGFDVRDMP